MSELDMTLVADRLYRAGYTVPRLRQLWGEPIASAVVRNNAAPAIHCCEKILNSAQAQEPFDQNLAALALLFHFHRDVSTETARAALGDDAFDVAVDRGLLVDGANDAAGKYDAAEVGAEGSVSAPFAITPYDLPVGVPRGFRPGDENPYLVS
ncbi:MAG: methyltransferase, partial [Brevibacterium aurantiacum]|nr:methyltransferase [Brevibacterium aurantiacum]